jgi:hypothetical protein
MQIGLVLPQGYFNEFEGWEPGRAWARIVELAQTAGPCRRALRHSCLGSASASSS